MPLTDGELDDLAKNLKPLVVPDVVLITYRGEEPVGFSVSLPDYNEVLKHLNGKVGTFGYLQISLLFKKINTIRVMLLGVKRAFQKKGVEGFLYIETLREGFGRDFIKPNVRGYSKVTP